MQLSFKARGLVFQQCIYETPNKLEVLECTWGRGRIKKRKVFERNKLQKVKPEVFFPLITLRIFS